jgi:hypothetical protein
MLNTFHESTPTEIKELLTRLNASRRRVRIWYGDTKTGRSWNEENSVTGEIGRSMGPAKIPLLIANRRSYGGGALLDHCIIRIDDINSRYILYIHPHFYTNLHRIGAHVYETKRTDGINTNTPTLIASFKDETKAKKFIEFMEGKRYAK